MPNKHTTTLTLVTLLSQDTPLRKKGKKVKKKKDKVKEKSIYKPFFKHSSHVVYMFISYQMKSLQWEQ